MISAFSIKAPTHEWIPIPMDKVGKQTRIWLRFGEAEMLLLRELWRLNIKQQQQQQQMNGPSNSGGNRARVCLLLLEAAVKDFTLDATQSRNRNRKATQQATDGRDGCCRTNSAQIASECQLLACCSQMIRQAAGSITIVAPVEPTGSTGSTGATTR